MGAVVITLDETPWEELTDLLARPTVFKPRLAALLAEPDVFQVDD